MFDIVNFPEVLMDGDIETISLTDTVLTIRIDHTKIQISLIDTGNGDVLYVVTQSEFEEN